MVYCRNCGNEMRPDEKMCTKCGAVAEPSYPQPRSWSSGTLIKIILLIIALTVILALTQLVIVKM